MGLPRSLQWTGYQAQHIIPGEMFNHPVIIKIGMDINHANNGILSPQAHCLDIKDITVYIIEL